MSVVDLQCVAFVCSGLARARDKVRGMGSRHAISAGVGPGSVSVSARSWLQDCGVLLLRRGDWSRDKSTWAVRPGVSTFQVQYAGVLEAEGTPRGE